MRISFVLGCVIMCYSGALRYSESLGEVDSKSSDPGSDSNSRLYQTFVSELIEVKPGRQQFPTTFLFGAGSRAREVKMQSKFRIAKYEVPQNLYEAVMGTNPSRWKGKRNSVEMMSINDAQKFCDKLTGHLHRLKLIDPGEVVRLPTETEWEYCCRAGTKTAYSFGDAAQKPGESGKQASLLDPYAWHTGNAAGNDPPVGALKPNPWGLYDVHGYLWEFVTQDKNSPEPDQPGQCVVRGGSWKDNFKQLTCVSRRLLPVTTRDDAVGFRCVVTERPRNPASESSSQ